MENNLEPSKSDQLSRFSDQSQQAAPVVIHPHTPVHTPQPKRNGFYFLIGLLLLFAVAASAYALGQMNKNATQLVPQTKLSLTEMQERPITSPQTTEEITKWKTYTNSEFGFELKYPPQFDQLGTLTLQRSKGETGESICISFKQQGSRLISQAYAGGSGCAATNLNIGLLSADFQAGREGGFSDSFGYEQAAGKVFYKFFGNKIEMPPQSVTIPQNSNGIEILKVIPIAGALQEGIGSPITVSEGTIGAIINTKDSKYPAITIQFNTVAVPELTAKTFDQILSTFKFISAASSPKADDGVKRVSGADENLGDIKLSLPSGWTRDVSGGVLLITAPGGGYFSITTQNLPQDVLNLRTFYCTTRKVCTDSSYFTATKIGNMSGYVGNALDNSGGGPEYFGAKGSKFYIISSYSPPSPSEFEKNHQKVFDSLVF